MEILPTHTCFNDALDFLEAEALAGRDIDHYVVVHAICVAPDGQRFAHAWVEDGDVVWSAGILGGQRIVYSAELASYLAHFNPIDATRYTLEEVVAQNRRHGHYGPWEDKYRELCGADRRVFGMAGG